MKKPERAGSLANAADPIHRRKHARKNLTRFVWYQTIEAVGDGPIEGLSYSVDASRGGLGLVVSDPIPVDSLVMVMMVFHSNQYNLAAVCRVAFAREQADGTHRLGLEYVVLPPDARQFLADNFA
ncbi:PilZ domain-containing protein [Myxococcota bacterium]